MYNNRPFPLSEALFMSSREQRSPLPRARTSVLILSNRSSGWQILHFIQGRNKTKNCFL